MDPRTASPGSGPRRITRASLSHPNIAQVFDYGEAQPPGTPAIW